MRRLTGTVLSARIEETANTVNRIMVILSHQLRTVLPTRHEGHPFRLTILSHFMGPRRFHRFALKDRTTALGFVRIGDGRADGGGRRCYDLPGRGRAGRALRSGRSAL